MKRFPVQFHERNFLTVIFLDVETISSEYLTGLKSSIKGLNLKLRFCEARFILKLTHFGLCIKMSIFWNFQGYI